VHLGRTHLGRTGLGRSGGVVTEHGTVGPCVIRPARARPSVRVGPS
jgi:hypothetical protein